MSKRLDEIRKTIEWYDEALPGSYRVEAMKLLRDKAYINTKFLLSLVDAQAAVVDAARNFRDFVGDGDNDAPGYLLDPWQDLDDALSNLDVLAGEKE